MGVRREWDHGDVIEERQFYIVREGVIKQYRCTQTKWGQSRGYWNVLALKVRLRCEDGLFDTIKDAKPEALDQITHRRHWLAGEMNKLADLERRLEWD